MDRNHQNIQMLNVLYFHMKHTKYANFLSLLLWNKSGHAMCTYAWQLNSNRSPVDIVQSLHEPYRNYTSYRKKNCVCVGDFMFLYTYDYIPASSSRNYIIVGSILSAVQKVCIPGSCHQSKLESPETSVAWLSPFTVCFFDFGSSDWHVHS